MVGRKLLGGLLILVSLFLTYRVYVIFTSWQYRNKEVLGISDTTPFIESAIAIIAGLVGIWLLLRRKSSG